MMTNTENSNLVLDASPSKSERALTNLQRLSYGVGHVFNDLVASVWFSYLLIFLHKVANFDSFLAGNLMMIGQILDAFCTPFIGYESDLTKTGFCKLGKRKSWHLAGSIGAFLSFPFLFQLCITCEHAPSIAQFVYYAPFVVIFQGCWAMIQISHLSYSSEITPYKQERVTLQSIRNSFTIVSNLSVYGIFTLLFYFDSIHDNVDSRSVGPSDAPKFRNLAFIIMGIGLISSAIFYRGTSSVGKNDMNQKIELTKQGQIEPSRAVEEGTPKTYTTMKWKDWLIEYQFYKIAVMYMCTRLYINLGQVYFVFYLTETVNVDKIFITILPLVTYLSSFITSFLAPFINKYLGRKMTFFVGLVFGAGSSVWFYLMPERSQQVYGGAVLMGIAGSILLITSLSMTSDLIATNTESGAFVFGAMSFTDKFSNGLAILLIQKFNPSHVHSDSSNYYRVVQSVIPAVSVVVAFLALLSLREEIGVRRIRSKGNPRPN